MGAGTVKTTNKFFTSLANLVKKKTTKSKSNSDVDANGNYKVTTTVKNKETGEVVKTTEKTKNVNAVSNTVSSLGKTTLKTAGVVGATVGTTALITNSEIPSLLSSGDDDSGGTDPTKEQTTVLDDETKKSMVEEILSYLNGGENGGGVAYVGGDGALEETGIVTEASSTISEYLPWVLGGLVVILILSAMSSPNKSKAEAVKA